MAIRACLFVANDTSSKWLLGLHVKGSPALPWSPLSAKRRLCVYLLWLRHSAVLGTFGRASLGAAPEANRFAWLSRDSAALLCRQLSAFHSTSFASLTLTHVNFNIRTPNRSWLCSSVPSFSLPLKIHKLFDEMCAPLLPLLLLRDSSDETLSNENGQFVIAITLHPLD